MGTHRIPGVVGTDPFESEGDADAGDTDAGSGGFAPPGITALDGHVRVIDRIVTAVTKDWVPPAPRTTPEIVVRGPTLAEVERNLNALAEWGEGGGQLRAERIPPGTTAEVTVTLHANLVLRLPRWNGYAQASAPAKAEWDRMVATLRAHEQRHVDIAIEQADALADALIGQEIGQVARMVTEANGTMRANQDQLDADTDHGAKPNVTYGGVVLDTTIQ